MGRKIWPKKTRVHAHLGQNLKNITIASYFSLKLLWKVIYISFLPEPVYIFLKKN